MTRTSAPSGLRVLVVDDESTARTGLRDLLSADPDLVVREAGGGAEAIEIIRSGTVDVVFLDIRMRDMDGFDVIRSVGVDRMPVVVFTTAFSAHAIRAFEACALDYLLKPIGEERLAQSVVRAKDTVRQRRLGAATAQLVDLLAQAGQTPPPRRAEHRMLVRSGVSTFYLAATDVDWIESADNYARVWTAGRSYLVREPIAELHTQLADAGFVRTHRTAVVNVARVREIRETLGRRMVVLVDGTRVPLSRSRRAAVHDAMSKAR